MCGCGLLRSTHTVSTYQELNILCSATLDLTFSEPLVVINT